MHPDHPPGWITGIDLVQKEHRVLRLPAPVRIFGIVTPADATLILRNRQPGVAGPPFRAITVQGDPEQGGAYQFRMIPSGISIRIVGDAKSYIQKVFGPFRFEGGEQRLDIVLELGLTLQGTVRDLAGRPVAGAAVIFGRQREVTDHGLQKVAIW